MKIKPGQKIKITDMYGKVNKYTYLGKADEFYCRSGFVRKLKPKGENEVVIFPESYYKKCKVELL